MTEECNVYVEECPHKRVAMYGNRANCCKCGKPIRPDELIAGYVQVE